MLTDEQRNELKTLILEYGIAAVMESSESRPRQINRIIDFVSGIAASAAPAEVDNWQQYAKEGETAQECIERHRAEQDALLKLYGRAAPAEGRDVHSELMAKIKEYGHLCDKVGRSRQENNYAINESAVKRSVDLIFEIDGMLRASLATAPTMSEAARDVLAERWRQVTAEGWTPEHDDEHSGEEMALAAIAYAESAVGYHIECPDTWPWSPKWWKPTTPRRDLVKAGALILAEIERIDRAAAKGGSDAG